MMIRTRRSRRGSLYAAGATLAAVLALVACPELGLQRDDAGAEDAALDGGGADAGPTLQIGEFVPFRDQSGSQLYFDYVQMVSASLGFATDATFASDIDLYETIDGGERWSLVGTIPTGNSGNGASYRFSADPDELWLTTYFSGYGITGTIGVSYDRGRNWSWLEDAIHALYSDYDEPFTTLARVRDEGLHVVLVTENRSSLARSSDVAAGWARSDLAQRDASLLATDSTLYLWGNETGSSDDWNVYSYLPSSGELVPLRDRLGADFWLTRWYTSPLGDVITLVDNESSHSPERSAYLATPAVTGVPFISHGASGDADGFRLERAFFVGGERAYVCMQSDTRTRIQGTLNGGSGWQTLLELSDTDRVYYFQSDFEGNVYAIAYSAYSTGFYRL